MVGDLIRRTRESRGLSQRALAAAVGVGFPHISKIETGHEAPSDALLVRLAWTLGLDADELVVAAGRVPEKYVRALVVDPARAVTYLRAYESSAGGASAREGEGAVLDAEQPPVDRGVGAANTGAPPDPTVVVDGVLYRRVRDDDPDELVGDHGTVFVPVDPEALPPNPVADILRESAERSRTPVQWDEESARRLTAKVRDLLDGHPPVVTQEGYPVPEPEAEQVRRLAVALDVWNKINQAADEIQPTLFGSNLCDWLDRVARPLIFDDQSSAGGAVQMPGPSAESPGRRGANPGAPSDRDEGTVFYGGQRWRLRAEGFRDDTEQVAVYSLVPDDEAMVEGEDPPMAEPTPWPTTPPAGAPRAFSIIAGVLHGAFKGDTDVDLDMLAADVVDAVTGPALSVELRWYDGDGRLDEEGVYVLGRDETTGDADG